MKEPKTAEKAPVENYDVTGETTEGRVESDMERLPDEPDTPARSSLWEGSEADREYLEGLTVRFADFALALRDRGVDVVELLDHVARTGFGVVLANTDMKAD